MRSYDYSNSNILEVIKNVAIYLRKSRGEGEEDLQKHRSVILDFCKKYEWNYVEYGEIVSGEKIENRPKMQELLQDVKDEMYDAIFVFDYDRLGRGSGGDQDTIIHTLKNSDTLVLEANPFNILDANDERDEDTIEFKGFLARREYKMIRKRLIAGKKISLKNGQWASGYAPFGYTINKDLKRLSVVHDQKDIFRNEILLPYLKGQTASKIIEKLEQANIKTNKGTDWNIKGLLYALTNRTYLGHTYYNKRDKKSELKPFEEWNVSLNTHEAIMTEAELNQVLAIKGDRKTGKKTMNALSGIIKCYNCDSTMRIRKDSGKPTIHRCLSCNENRGGSLEIVNATIATVLEGLYVSRNKETTEKDKLAMADKYRDAIKKSDAKISKIETAISKIEVAFEAGIYTVDKAKERLKQRQQELQEELSTRNNLTERMNGFSNRTSDYKKEVIEMAAKMIREGKGDAIMKPAYDALIDKIIWERSEWNEVKVSVALKF